MATLSISACDEGTVDFPEYGAPAPPYEGNTGGTGGTGGSAGEQRGLSGNSGQNDGPAGSGGAPAGQCTSITEFGAGGEVHILPTVPGDGHPCSQEGLEICTQQGGFAGNTSALSRCTQGKWTTVESPSTCHPFIAPPTGPCNAEINQGLACDQTSDGVRHVFRCVDGQWSASSEDPAVCAPVFQQCNQGVTDTQGPVAAEGNCCQMRLHCNNYGLYCDGTRWRKY